MKKSKQSKASDMKELLLMSIVGALIFLIGVLQVIMPWEFIPPLPYQWLSIICMCIGGGLLFMMSISLLIIETILKRRNKNKEG